MFLSGTVIPIEEMPLALQYLSWFSPIRYYMEIAAGIFLKGTGIAILWPQFLYLAAFGAIILPLSLRRLGKRIYD
jgi:ABC-2 type transport system permease protein